MEKPIVYHIHIPKTGGISLRTALKNSTAIDSRNKSHVTASFWANKIFPNILDEQIVCTIVRNPYDRLRSGYRYYKAMTPNNRFWKWSHVVVSFFKDIHTFEQFVEMLPTSEFLKQSLTFQAQHRFLMRSGNLDYYDIDTLMHFESLAEDYQAFQQRLGVELAPLEHLNASERNDAADYITPQMQKIIADYYAKDFELFGYDKDNVPNQKPPQPARVFKSVNADLQTKISSWQHLGSTTIYSPGPGLGDNWYMLNKVLHFRQNDEEPILISRFNRPERNKRLDVMPRLRELLPLIDAPGIERVQIVNARPKTFGIGFMDTPWDEPYFPTKEVWKKQNADTKTICYQFDGCNMKAKGGLPSRHFLNELFKQLHKRGYKLIYVGAPLPLAIIVRYLATCKCFLGMCSGITHLAHSVGTPRCLVQSGGHDITGHHSNKEYTLVENVDDMLKFVEDLDKV